MQKAERRATCWTEEGDQSCPWGVCGAYLVVSLPKMLVLITSNVSSAL